MSHAVTPTQLSILVVDDEEPVREIVSSLLEDSGYTVYPAADGYKALAFLRSEKPVNLVLSDINMPGIDGLALCKLIKTEFPSLPVLLISGRPPPVGVKAFVAKPFRASSLTQAIEQLASAAEIVQVDLAFSC